MDRRSPGRQDAQGNRHHVFSPGATTRQSVREEEPLLFCHHSPTGYRLHRPPHLFSGTGVVYAIFIKTSCPAAEITGGDETQSVPLWLMGWQWLILQTVR